MIHDSVFIEGSMTKIISLNTVIVGGGIAGLAAAVDLYDRGVRDIAVLIDTKEGATSRYAKSDGQGYYKLAEYGNESDSPYRMAKALAVSGNMDGDQALLEASSSSRCFYRILEMGIPFEQDLYGAFTWQSAGTGAEKRSVSAGSDTANRMEAAWEREIKSRDIPVFDNHQVIRLITDDDRKKVVGVLALNRSGVRERHQRFLLFNASNVVMATGGPGGLFFHEGYPRTHTGCAGISLMVGAQFQNIAEFTFGLCAVRRSLMMNRAFQKALPRFVSTDETGRDVQEFLLPYFDSPEELYELQRQKGTQWSFDSKKVRTDGSSLIDLLVYNEIVVKERHVFMDYRENPKDLPEKYLVDGEKPYDRLRNLGEGAYLTLLDQNMDPKTMPVEIYPSAVHHNGGVSVDINAESSLTHLYVIGEAAGTHGSILPAGASLNQTQVTALRAAEKIAADSHDGNTTLPLDSFVAFARNDLHEVVSLADSFMSWLDPDLTSTAPKRTNDPLNIRAARLMIGKKMDRACAMYRDKGRIQHEMEKAEETLSHLDVVFKPEAQTDLCLLFQIEDLLITQKCILKAMLNEMELTTASRGSHISYDPDGSLPNKNLMEMYRFSVSEHETAGKIQTLHYDKVSREIWVEWREARSLPRMG